MTLVLALQGIDGIILSSDGRSTIGDPRGFMMVRDGGSKLYRLSSHCGLGLAGSSELSAALVDRMHEQIISRGMVYVSDIARFVRGWIKDQYEDWFQQMPADRRPIIGAIVAGYDKKPDTDTMEPKIFTFSSDLEYAPMLCDSGAYFLGLPLFATYLTNRFYNRNAPVSQLMALSDYIISETASQDPKVGGPTSIAVISPESEYRILEENEILGFRRQNEKEVSKLQEYFGRQ